MVVFQKNWGHFMKNLHFNTICNITQEPHKLQRYKHACEFISKSAVIKYYQLLSKVISFNRKSHFNQFDTATSSTPPIYLLSGLCYYIYHTFSLCLKKIQGLEYLIHSYIKSVHMLSTEDSKTH